MRHIASPIPVPRERVLGMQALEDHEDPLGILGLDADPVVRASELPALAVSPGIDPDDGRIVAVELHRVGDEVLKDRGEQRGIPADHRQVANDDRRARGLDRRV